jgi:hypothetical protein
VNVRSLPLVSGTRMDICEPLRALLQPPPVLRDVELTLFLVRAHVSGIYMLQIDNNTDGGWWRELVAELCPRTRSAALQSHGLLLGAEGPRRAAKEEGQAPAHGDGVLREIQRQRRGGARRWATSQGRDRPWTPTPAASAIRRWCGVWRPRRGGRRRIQ